jgi:hypothetical protein
MFHIHYMRPGIFWILQITCFLSLFVDVLFYIIKNMSAIYTTLVTKLLYKKHHTSTYKMHVRSVGPIDCTRSVDPIDCTRFVDPIDSTRSVGPIDCTRSVDPIDCTRSVGPIDCTRSVYPIDCTRSEGSIDCTSV